MPDSTAHSTRPGDTGPASAAEPPSDARGPRDPFQRRPAARHPAAPAAAREERGGARGDRGADRGDARKRHADQRRPARAAGQHPEAARQDGGGRHGAAGRHLGHRRRHAARRGGAADPGRGPFALSGLSRVARRRDRHDPHQGRAGLLGHRQEVQSARHIASRRLRGADLAGARHAARHAPFAHPHGAGGRRVRRHRRAAHHRGSGRGDRGRDRGRARRRPDADASPVASTARSTSTAARPSSSWSRRSATCCPRTSGARSTRWAA